MGPLLPAAVPAEDAAELLQRCAAVQHALSSKASRKPSSGGGGGDGGSGSSAVVSGTCIASGQLVAELAERVRGEARSAAEHQLKLQQQRKAATAAPPQPQGGKLLQSCFHSRCS